MDFNYFLGSDPDFRGSRELNRSLGRPGEGQGGPNKGQLEPKIGQNLQSKKLYKSRTLVYRALDSYMELFLRNCDMFDILASPISSFDAICSE